MAGMADRYLIKRGGGAGGTRHPSPAMVKKCFLFQNAFLISTKSNSCTNGTACRGRPCTNIRNTMVIFFGGVGEGGRGLPWRRKTPSMGPGSRDLPGTPVSFSSRSLGRGSAGWLPGRAVLGPSCRNPHCYAVVTPGFWPETGQSDVFFDMRGCMQGDASVLQQMLQVGGSMLHPWRGAVHGRVMCEAVTCFQNGSYSRYDGGAMKYNPDSGVEAAGEG